MEYNRALNAAIIGYVLILILIAVSAALYTSGQTAALASGALGVLSLVFAYVHENAVTALDYLDREEAIDQPAYALAYKNFKVAAIAVPATTGLGYLFAFILLLIGA